MAVALASDNQTCKRIARYMVPRPETGIGAIAELKRLIDLEADCQKSGMKLNESQVKKCLDPLFLEPSCRFYMRGVKKYRDENKLWFSEPFYSESGYQFRLIIYANGEGEAEGKNLSVFAQVMDGEFHGSITVILLDQTASKKMHLKRKIEFNDPPTPSVVPTRTSPESSGLPIRARVVGGRRNPPLNPHRNRLRNPNPRMKGIREFARLVPGYNSPYEKEDCSIFEVSVVHTF